MVNREPYDQERIVRHSEVVDEPTHVLPTTPVARTGAVYNVRDDAVVVERPVGHVQPVYPVSPGYDANAVREDITIDHVVERRAMLDRVTNVIWFAAGTLLTLIGLRVVFRLLEASRDSGFVRFIYGFTEPFVRPFQGIFADPAADGAVLDSAALTAMVIYALLTWGIVRLLWILLDRSETGARRSVSQVHSDHL